MHETANLPPRRQFHQLFVDLWKAKTPSSCQRRTMQQTQPSAITFFQLQLIDRTKSLAMEIGFAKRKHQRLILAKPRAAHIISGAHVMWLQHVVGELTRQTLSILSRERSPQEANGQQSIIDGEATPDTRYKAPLWDRDITKTSPSLKNVQHNPFQHFQEKK